MQETAVLALIARLSSSRRNPVRGDDIGLLPGSGRFYAATDSLVENTHYRDLWLRPGEIAYRLFARNWSDFLCKGITPESALLNLGLRRRPAADKFTRDFLLALDRLLTKYKITLVGGDATRTGHDHFSLSLFGRRGKFIPRGAPGLRPGDLLLQLGSVGGSDAGRHLLTQSPGVRNTITRGFRRPHIFERLPGAARLLAAIDQSDSVAKSLMLLAHANRAVLHVELSRLQATPGFRAMCHERPELLPGASEDLAVFALARGQARPVLSARLRAAAFRPIGEVKTIRAKRPGVHYFWRGRNVLPLVDEFEHF